jgi:hypothetical protein
VMEGAMWEVGLALLAMLEWIGIAWVGAGRVRYYVI